MTGFVLAAALLGALLAAPIALAANPAGEEYTLDLPGIRDNALSGTATAAPVETGGVTEQAGVAGEAPPATASSLESLVATLSGSAAAVAVTLFLLLAIAAPLGLRLHRPRTG